MDRYKTVNYAEQFHFPFVIKCMSKFIIISTIVLGVLALAYYFIVENLEDVETQKYYVEKEDNLIEIRIYEESIIARTSAGGDYKEASSKGFRKLAGYIFGSNKEDKKIAMTSPVWMSTNSENSEMHFIMPSEYDMAELPEPADMAVKLDNFTGGKFASIEFGGYADDEKLEANQKKLAEWLVANNYDPTGESFFVGYNSPFKIYNRRNEILIALN